MAIHISSGFGGVFAPSWITLAVRALACLSCLLFETGWGHALEPPQPIARTAVGEQSLELQAVLKLRSGSGALVNNENLFLLARDEVLSPLTAQAGITPWKSTQRVARSQSYVLGLLLRDSDGSLPLASVKASTIYNAITDAGEEIRYWPFARSSPLQEACGYEWNFQLAPLIVELPATAQHLTRLEGALIQFPSSVQRLVFTKKQVEERALPSTHELIVTLLRSEPVKEGIGFEFLVMRPADPHDSGGNRASRNSSRQSPSANLNPIPFAMQGSGTGFEASLLVSAGDLRKQAAYSVTTLSMEQRRRLIAEVRRTLSGGPDSPEERLNQLALSKDTVVEILSIFFDKVTGFEQINLSYTRPLGAPMLQRFVLENIPLRESANEALVNQYVASLESQAPQQPQGDLRTEVADSRFEPRTWRDTTGKFSVEAKLVDVLDDSVRLEKADGKQLTVPLAKLSQADQEYVQAASTRPRSPLSSPQSPADGSTASPPAAPVRGRLGQATRTVADNARTARAF